MNYIWIIVIAIAGMLNGCSSLLEAPRYGMYGGKPREAKAEPPFDINATKWGTRWFPAHTRWAPDDSHLLVSLCHVERTRYCRIGKYWIAEKRWELLDLEPRTTYLWPSYSPDGKRIAVVVSRCRADYECGDYHLKVLSADGRQTLAAFKTLAWRPSFSDDGKQIIYWRHTGSGGADVALFDLPSGKERRLMDFVLWGTHVNAAPYFLPGGRFVFSAEVGTGAHLPTEMVRDKNGRYVRDERGQIVVSHPFDGTKLDIHGPNKGGGNLVSRLDTAPVTLDTVTQLDMLWNDGLGASAPLDVTRDGEVLYESGYQPYQEKLKRGLYRGNRIADFTDDTIDIPTIVKYSKGILLMLRPGREDATDVAAFYVNRRYDTETASLSHDKRRIAFATSTVIGYRATDSLAMATRGNSTPEYLDWPRLDLDPAATQRIPD